MIFLSFLYGKKNSKSTVRKISPSGGLRNTTTFLKNYNKKWQQIEISTLVLIYLTCFEIFHFAIFV